MSDKMTKRISLSQILEDLNSGLTRWKKDDIGFGSLEKKYNLTIAEAVELFAHPKVKDVETRIPTFVIVDDLPDSEPEPEQPKVIETRVEVTPVVKVEAPTPVVRKAPQARLAVEEVKEEPVLVPFI